MSQTANSASTAGPRLRLAVDRDGMNTQGPHVTAQCDALADLFMGAGALAPRTEPADGAPLPSSRLGPISSNSPAPPQSEGPATALRSGPAPVEALVLGHLPVLASAWAPQYARALAAKLSRPLALLRFRAGTTTVEVFGAQREVAHQEEPDFDSAIARASDVAARWVVSVDATGEPGMADLWRAKAIACLTLLTGADDAATVACYRTLKSLLGDCESSDPVPVRIGVMGTSGDSARAAGDRLARAAEAFLGFRPEVFTAGARLEPAQSTIVFRGSADRGVGDVLNAIGRTRAARAVAPAPIDRKQDASAAPLVERAPAPAPRATPARPAPVLDLTSFLPGLRILPVRCPYAREVQFGACADGIVHVLAHDAAANAQPIASLAAAGAWATTNAELLAGACPGIAPPGVKPIVQHLFTRDARRVRGLLDASVKVHLLVPTSTHEDAALVAGELN